MVTCQPEWTDTTVRADSQCRSPGDARVNAGAMSRRKQVNPQHFSLTRRETARGELNTRKTHSLHVKCTYSMYHVHLLI